VRCRDGATGEAAFLIVVEAEGLRRELRSALAPRRFAPSLLEFWLPAGSGRDQ
jgi:hypothetical protein